MKKALGIALVSMILVTGCIPAARLAEDRKSLSKADAAKILDFMGYKNVTIGAIVEGAGPLNSGGNGATVIGVGTGSNHFGKIEQVFSYDSDLGWFCYQFNANGTLSLWSLAGFKEVVITMPRQQ